MITSILNEYLEHALRLNRKDGVVTIMADKTVRYESPEGDKALLSAVSDVKKHIGPSNWDTFIISLTAIVVPNFSMATLRVACSLLGVEGYPVTALAWYITSILNIPMPKEEAKGMN